MIQHKKIKKKCHSDAIISQFNLQILIELKVAKNRSLPSIRIIQKTKNINWHII